MRTTQAEEEAGFPLHKPLKRAVVWRDSQLVIVFGALLIAIIAVASGVSIRGRSQG